MKLFNVCRLLLASLVLSFPFSAQALVISEVYVNAPGGDNGLEWVELFNPSASAIDLSGYTLGNAGSDYTYSAVSLSGMIGAGSYFLVGGPVSSGGYSFDLAIDFNPDFQNGGSTADGVALFSPSMQILDAVLYGGSNNNGLLDASGIVALVNVGAPPAGSSIERMSVAGDWQIQSAPTPGSGSLATSQVPSLAPNQIPEPSVLTLMALGVMMILVFKTKPTGDQLWHNITSIFFSRQIC